MNSFLEKMEKPINLEDLDNPTTQLFLKIKKRMEDTLAEYRIDDGYQKRTT